MRVPKFVCLFAVASAVLALCGVASGANPQLAAKRQQAKVVIAEINAIDERLNGVVEQYDGARVKLDAVQARLRAEESALARARVEDKVAKQRVAKLLVSLYESGSPSSADVLLGARSISELIDLSTAQSSVSHEVQGVASTAVHARRTLALRVREVKADRVTAERAVRELAARKAQIEHGLAQRQRLLASVRTEISRLEAEQRARQERLAAEARARLAAERAAAARAEARARAEQQRRERAAARTYTAAQSPAPAQQSATTPSAPTFDPAASASGGHPQAAQIALQYIGVPYVWGGSSPSGFDCSGLVSYVFAQLGIDLPHYAAAQYGYGVPVPFDQLQPGDLVFFDGLGHVGIYIGNGQYVDAPHTGAFVRIDSLCDSWATANYVGARRI